MTAKKAGESFDIRERRLSKVAEKQNLEKRKRVKDRHYHVVDEDEDDNFEYVIKGKKNG
jgi:hypothetical protein